MDEIIFEETQSPSGRMRAMRRGYLIGNLIKPSSHPHLRDRFVFCPHYCTHLTEDELMTLKEKLEEMNKDAN